MVINKYSVVEESSSVLTDRGCAAFSYYGDECEIIGTNVTCIENPCLNNGTCLNDPTKGYNCSCLASFTGVQCETELDLPVPCPEFYYGKNCSTHCEPANDCEHGHFICNTTTGEKLCNAGFKGTDCKERDVEGEDPECPTVGSCKNGGNCFNKSCCCVPGYIGDICESEAIECDSNPCLNKGTCKDEFNAYRCVCAPGKFICYTFFSPMHCLIHTADPV